MGAVGKYLEAVIEAKANTIDKKEREGYCALLDAALADFQPGVTLMVAAQTANLFDGLDEEETEDMRRFLDEAPESWQRNILVALREALSYEPGKIDVEYVDAEYAVTTGYFGAVSISQPPTFGLTISGPCPTTPEAHARAAVGRVTTS